MTTLRTFQPVAGVASAQGLDVSNYQGRFNWKAASGLSFGINRVTQGLGGPATNSPDPEAGWNHAAIRDAGLHRGAYHFLDPRLDGAAQARYFTDTLGAHGLVASDMLWCDNETTGPSSGATAACAAAFMTELRKLRPDNPIGVYTFISFAREGNCDGLGGWPLWLAYPATSAPLPPPPWIKWTFWQWGTRNGVDADAFNGTADSLAAWIGSFQPAPAGPYRHVTDGHTTLAGLAASRNMTVTGFLAEQAHIYATQPAALAALSAAVPPAGVPYFTVHP